VRLWEGIQRFLQEADRWLTGKPWAPPRLLEANGSMGQDLGRSQGPGKVSGALKGVTGLQEIAGSGLRLTQSQQQRTQPGAVQRFLALQALERHLVKAHGLSIGWQRHIAVPRPYRILDSPGDRILLCNLIEMVRQLPVVLLQAIGKQRLQRYRHAGVQRLALGRQQTAIGYLLRQRMLEEIGCLRRQAAH